MFTMREAFLAVEAEILGLMKDESPWQGLYIDYHPPIVERIWCQWGAYRVSLHKMYPCGEEEALFHAHAWPQYIKIISGTQEVGVADMRSNFPPAHLIVSSYGSGNYYEMTNPFGGHYVRPIDRPSFSVMLTGSPWSVHHAPKSTKPLRQLTPEEFRKNFDFFRDYYWHHQNDALYPV